MKKTTKEQAYLSVFGAAFARIYEDEHSMTTECPVGKDCDRIAEEASAVAESAADAAERIGLLYIEPAVKTCGNCKHRPSTRCYSTVGNCDGEEKWEPSGG